MNYFIRIYWLFWVGVGWGCHWNSYKLKKLWFSMEGQAPSHEPSSFTYFSMRCPSHKSPLQPDQEYNLIKSTVHWQGNYLSHCKVRHAQKSDSASTWESWHELKQAFQFEQILNKGADNFFPLKLILTQHRTSEICLHASSFSSIIRTGASHTWGTINKAWDIHSLKRRC